LSDYGVVTHIYDPVASVQQAFNDFGLQLSSWENLPTSAAIISAVPHQEIVDLTIEDIEEKLLPGGLYVDVKAQANKEELTTKGYHVWRL
jgi:UDP-N-acetyl-D-galactosamine dehydrogenase